VSFVVMPASLHPSIKNVERLIRLTASFAVVQLCTPFSSFAQEPDMAGRSTVYAPHGVIATSQPLATSAGLAVLQRGGNAIDAAVTAAAVLALTEAHMTGIGGDLFAMVWSGSQGRLFGLNASGRSGSRMTRDELLRRGYDGVPDAGAEAITVPGALAGWDALRRRFGSISLGEALAPAIALANDGLPLSPIIAHEWAGEAEALRERWNLTGPVGTTLQRAFAATFMPNGERPLKAGEWFRNPDLAETFRAIAAHGPDVLYRGPLGARIVKWVGDLGGFLTEEDLAAHRVEWVEPISVAFRGYRVWELPPNSQGVAALEMLRILEPFDLAAFGHNTAAYFHHLVEAKKLAYADLDYFVGDPDEMSIDPDDLLTDEFIADRRGRLDRTRAADRPEPGAPITSSETIYLTAADSAGNMVSFINSIYSAFGSGVVVPGTGFALQNRGAGFTLDPNRANTVAPRKRPFHTIIPAFVTRSNAAGDQEPWLSFGVMGGSMQPQGHVQVLLNLIVFGMDLQEAVDAARFRHLSGTRVAIEAPVGGDVRTALRSLGHDVLDGAGFSFGGAQAIMRLVEGGWASASDPRKDGMAAGH
jgi:gamma-glutamyltranspeptidase / glutathione hydrolase